MRNTVAFAIPDVRWPDESDEAFSDVLPVTRAAWFTEILRRIDGVTLDETPCQEDWGVVWFARLDGLQFWIGLTYGDGDGDAGEDWLAHVHHGSFALVQRFTRRGTQARRRLALALDRALRAAGATAIRWYDERDAEHRAPSTSPD